jgi:hypothetical protein
MKSGKSETEWVLCAAIWFDDGVDRAHNPVNIETGIVACGLRHANCFTILSAVFPGKEYLDCEKSTQGFLTSHGRFLNRAEAGKLALENGQLEELMYYGGKELDSSDLY